MNTKLNYTAGMQHDEDRAYRMMHDRWLNDEAVQILPFFRWGRFTAHSGAELMWKIECDALTPEDWDCAARMVASKLPRFSEVLGVPRGGQRFADALKPLASGRGGDIVLICDDVLTTGGAIDEYRDIVMSNRHGIAVGIVLVARGRCPSWVRPVLEVAPWLR